MLGCPVTSIINRQNKNSLRSNACYLWCLSGVTLCVRAALVWVQQQLDKHVTNCKAWDKRRIEKISYVRGSRSMEMLDFGVAFRHVGAPLGLTAILSEDSLKIYEYDNTKTLTETMSGTLKWVNDTGKGSLLHQILSGKECKSKGCHWKESFLHIILNQIPWCALLGKLMFKFSRIGELCNLGCVSS